MAGNNKITRKENISWPVSFSSGDIRKSGRATSGNILTSGKLHFEIEAAGHGASCSNVPREAGNVGNPGNKLPSQIHLQKRI